MHRFTAVLFLAAFVLSAADKPKDKFSDPLKPFVENFKGRGALTDGSKPLPPAETVKSFNLADGLAMQVVAHEPAVEQPLAPAPSLPPSPPDPSPPKAASVASKISLIAR